MHSSRMVAEFWFSSGFVGRVHSLRCRVQVCSSVSTSVFKRFVVGAQCHPHKRPRPVTGDSGSRAFGHIPRLVSSNVVQI